MIPMHRFTRRNLLRGMMGGAAVTVGLPFLDCFLNTNGTALADGQALPVNFGTWFWGLGLNPGRWEFRLLPSTSYVAIDFHGARGEQPENRRADGWVEVVVRGPSSIRWTLSDKPGAIHGVQVHIEQNFGSAIDQISKGKVDGRKSVFRSPDRDTSSIEGGEHQIPV